jgi:hypothetical protein
MSSGLAAAIEAEPAVRGQVTAESDGVDTVTVSGLTAGVAFTMSDADANLTTTEETVAADDADVIPFGRAIVKIGQTDDGEKKLALPTPAVLEPQVSTVTVVYEAADIYLVTVTIKGIPYQFDVTADTDSTTTAAAIVTDMNNRFPANTVLAASALGVITLTAEVEGVPFTVSVGNRLTQTNIVTADTNVGALTDFARCFEGISRLAYDEETIPQGGGDPTGYPAKAGVRYQRAGQIGIDTAETPADGGFVYVETAAGSSAGKLYAASSATRITVPRDLLVWRRYDSTDSVASVDIRAGSYPG